MENFFEFVDNLRNRFQELSATNKAVALGVLAAILGSLFAMTLWVQTPDMQLLYANLDEKDAAEIVEQLKTQNIKYELGNNERSIRVPADMVHELRLNLASQGLPTGKEVGLELFEDTPLGMTEFVQKLNFQRALQGELSRTIGALDSVETARVHLVIPKDDVFLKDKAPGTASVMLKIRAGKHLAETQVQGIVHLVASSVEGVEAKNVVVVDLKGNILSGNQEGTEGALLTASNHKHRKHVEKELEHSIVQMLEDALGPDKIIARVTADINFDKVEKTEEFTIRILKWFAVSSQPRNPFPVRFPRVVCRVWNPCSRTVRDKARVRLPYPQNAITRNRHSTMRSTKLCAMSPSPTATFGNCPLRCWWMGCWPETLLPTKHGRRKKWQNCWTS